MIDHEFCQFSSKLVFAGSMNIFRQYFVGDLNPCLKSSKELFQLLFFSHDMTWDVHIYIFFYFVTHHTENTFMHIGTFENSTAISIDHFTLFGNHIVIIDHVLTNVEVVSLNSCLSLFYETRNHATFKRHIFVHTDHLHDF